MRLVIADTSPINYLALIGHIGVLPTLFDRVILPAAVHRELTSRKTPTLVRNWIESMPPWIELREDPMAEAGDVSIGNIDAGEKAAILLAASLNADLLLIDDRKGVSAARRIGLRVTGTLGVLDLAAGRGLVNFAEAIQRLEATNFRLPAAIVGALLRKHGGGGI